MMATFRTFSAAMVVAGIMANKRIAKRVAMLVFALSFIS
jgi:hypothetical protein